MGPIFIPFRKSDLQRVTLFITTTIIHPCLISIILPRKHVRGRRGRGRIVVGFSEFESRSDEV